MEKDYKQMWEDLRKSIKNGLAKGIMRQKDLSDLGMILSMMIEATFKLVLGKMDALETGVNKCIRCGVVIEDGKSMCDDCQEATDNFKNLDIVNEMLFKGMDDDDITFGDLKYEGNK